jgi:hypothetical protein
MGTDLRSGWILWLPLAVVVVWVSATAPLSVTVSVWGLAVLCSGAAIARWVLSGRSPFAIRRRSVDVSILAAFAVCFAFLAMTGRLG